LSETPKNDRLPVPLFGSGDRGMGWSVAEPIAWRGAALARGIENLATFFTARLPPKHVLNRRLPGITQRIVFVQRLHLSPILASSRCNPGSR